MSSTVEDFKKRSRKTITLPSGLEVEIRRLHLWDFVGIGEVPYPSPQESSNSDKSEREITPEQMKEVHRYSSQAIIKGSVNPKFTDANEPNAVDVRDLEDEDFQVLAESILNWMGIGRSEAEAANNFRDDAIGTDGEHPGGEISPTANGDSKPNTG